MRRKQKTTLALPHKGDHRNIQLPTLARVLFVESLDLDVSQSNASTNTGAIGGPRHLGERFQDSEGSTEATIPQTTGAWECLPAPALVLIGSSLPQQDVVMLRMVCKAWAAHLGEAVKEAAPSPYPLLAHKTIRKEGMHRRYTLQYAQCCLMSVLPGLPSQNLPRTHPGSCHSCCHLA